MADTYVSFSKDNSMDSYTPFKSIPETNDNQDPFQVDQRDIDELKNQASTNPIEKTKKSKRNNSNPNSTKSTGGTPTVQCDICCVPISGPIVFDSHVKGKRHQTQLKTVLTKNAEYKAPTYEELCLKKSEPIVVNNQGEQTEVKVSETVPVEQPIATPLIPIKKLNCNMCNISCNSQQMFDNHIAGKKHQMKLKQSMVNTPAPPRTGIDNNPTSSNYCDICSLKLNSENELSDHFIQKHQQKAKEEEVCAKEGADLNINFDDYKISSTGTEKNNFEFQCTPCNKKLRNKRQLIAHLKSGSHNKIINRPSNQNTSNESNQIKSQPKQENVQQNNPVAHHPSSSSYRRSNKPQGKPRPFRSQTFPTKRTFPQSYEPKFDSHNLNQQNFDPQNFDQQNYDPQNYSQQNFDLQNFNQQNFDQQTSQNIFGAFDPNNESIYPSTTTYSNNNYSSKKRSKPYDRNSNDYGGFRPKRTRPYQSGTDNSVQNYYANESDYYQTTATTSYSWDTNNYPAPIEDYNSQSSIQQTSWEYPTEPSYSQPQYSNTSSTYMNTMHYPSNPPPPPLPSYEQPPLPNYPPPSSYTHSQSSAFMGSTANLGNNSYFRNAYGQ